MIVEYVRERQLPTEPFVQLREHAEVEYSAQDAHIIGHSAWKRNIGLAEAWVEQEALR